MVKKQPSSQRKKKVKKKPTKRAGARSPRSPGDEGSTEYLALDVLLLDSNNPRLGGEAGRLKSQTEILDAIVNTFGVDDVLSSLAVNGYFDAEPLVGVRIKTEVVIKEGNRRLAACLILAGDPRAKNHARRTAQYQDLQEKYQQSPIDRVPVQIVADNQSLLSYLGVRHIAASQPWDSFAKAAWVAKILRTSDLTLDDVSSMIGDQHRTVARALEGYFFVNQLRDRAHFNPSDSTRPGRGSNPEYPFSWVYTALGYAPIREWLGLDEPAGIDAADEQPLQAEKLQAGGELMTFLFGNKSKQRNPAIGDSRQISDLAKAIALPQSRRLLERGRSVLEVAFLQKPAGDRVADNLLDAQQSLTEALGPLAEGEVSVEEAETLHAPSKRVKSLATEVGKQILSIMAADEE